MATRRERVVLELEDQFTTGMARAAASAALLNKELGNLDDSNVSVSRSTRQADRDVDHLGRTAHNAESDIDRLSGRVRILAEVTALLSPALIPVGSVAIPAVTGLASALGVAAVGAGTFAVAWQGVGDALDAVEKARIEPTTENLNAARVALSRLSPEAQQFIGDLQEMIPELRELRDTSAAGMFPGFSEGLDGLERALPRVQRLLGAISMEIGEIAAETGTSLGSERWAPFLDFLAVEGPAALGELAAAVGSTAHGLAGLWMSFDPLNDDVLSGLREVTADFDRWANDLGDTRGYQEFVDYVRVNGPKVADTLGAIADAGVEVVQAAAPLGGPVLEGIESLARVVAEIADSPIGTPILTAVTLMSTLNLATRVYEGLQRATFGGPAVARIRGTAAALTAVTTAQQRATMSAQQLAAAEARRRGIILRGSAAAAGLALATTGVADSIGLQNSVMLGSAGLMAGPWGAAIGASVGLLADAHQASEQFSKSIDRIDQAIRNNDLDELNAGLADATKQLDDLQKQTGVNDFFDDMWDSLWGSDAGVLGAGPLAQILQWTGAIDSAAGNLQDAIDDANSAISDLTGGPARGIGHLLTQGLGRGARQAAADVDGATEAVAEFLSQLDVMENKLNRSRAFIAAREELRELRRVVEENPLGKDFNAGSAQADAVRTQLLDLVESVRSTAKELTGERQIAYLRNFRRNVIEMAMELGLPLAATRNLLDQFGIVNATPVRPKVDPEPARQGARQVRTALSEITDNEWLVAFGIDVPANRRQVSSFGAFLNDFLKKPRNINITTTLQNPGKPGGIFELLTQPITPADGTTVPGRRLPYRDSVPALLAPGEEVISNRYGQADRWRPFLKAVNDNRLAHGGTVGTDWSRARQTITVPFPRQQSTGLSDSDINRLSAAMLNARPIWGDMHVQPHNYNDFLRDLQQGRALASLDGHLR